MSTRTVVTCDGCGRDVEPGAGGSRIPVLSGRRVDGVSGGFVPFAADQQYDWCALCSAVAARSAKAAGPLVAAADGAGLTQLDVRELFAYLRDPLSVETAEQLAAQSPENRRRALRGAYASPYARRLAEIVVERRIRLGEPFA